jgi:hypothetical protein
MNGEEVRILKEVVKIYFKLPYPDKLRKTVSHLAEIPIR